MLKMTAVLIGMALLSAACSTHQGKLDSPESAGPTARIRVFSLPNDFYLFPAQSCYTAPVDKAGIIAHTGGKSYSVLNPLSVIGSNKKIGIPETDDMTWVHHEFRVPADKPLTLVTWYRRSGEVNNQFHYSNCGPITGKFTPQEGNDYDAGLIFEGGRCYLRVRNLGKDKLSSVEIALEKASACE